MTQRSRWQYRRFCASHRGPARQSAGAAVPSSFSRSHQPAERRWQSAGGRPSRARGRRHRWKRFPGAPSVLRTSRSSLTRLRSAGPAYRGRRRSTAPTARAGGTRHPVGPVRAILPVQVALPAFADLGDPVLAEPASALALDKRLQPVAQQVQGFADSFVVGDGQGDLL